VAEARGYEPNPRYPPVGGRVARSWDAAVATLPDVPIVLAVDGPAVAHWDEVVAGIARAAIARGREIETLDMRGHLAAWDRIVARTASPTLPEDPDFTTLADASIAELFDDIPDPGPPDDLLLVAGPGAGLVRHDVLWYADLPKRYADAAIGAGAAANLGQRSGPGTARRLYYVDWPIVDRHRDAIAPRIDRWIDVQRKNEPRSIDAETLRRTIADLARRPFRTRPTFNTAPWGGHWGQSQLGQRRDAPNTAIGYELIAPESGVLIGDGDAQVEIPFSLIVARLPREILGEPVMAAFGTSFPIRFDYLDTVGGGNLSVHCHPRAEYMRAIFGWPYTQHESYYVMVGGDGRHVYLGLRGDGDLADFEAAAQAADEHHRPFEIERFVQTFPAAHGQLFMIPAGTPHGSAEGNVILEVSATPYLYSLRFYDWLRRDGDGNQRPVHVGHAFANLDPERRGDRVRGDLVQSPRTLRDGGGWREELIGALPEVFFEVRRIVIGDDEPAPDETGDRFHILNVVDGDGVTIETDAGDRHPLAYAETAVVPAAVGGYRLRRKGAEEVRVVKSLVR
jgi:mannose-6-phosphate isomerase class I